jgi:ADP-L-glycero-D-manno-heptose 6-epimerase
LDLATAVFASLQLPVNIQYTDMPSDIRDRYQYHTQADMSRLVAAGYKIPFTPLEIAVEDYVSNYLSAQRYL